MLVYYGFVRSCPLSLLVGRDSIIGVLGLGHPATKRPPHSPHFVAMLTLTKFQLLWRCLCLRVLDFCSERVGLLWLFFSAKSDPAPKSPINKASNECISFLSHQPWRPHLEATSTSKERGRQCEWRAPFPLNLQKKSRTDRLERVQGM